MGRQHQGARAIRQRVVGVRAGRQQKLGRFRIAVPRCEQQRRHAAPLHRVVQLFPARPLRLFPDHRLRVDAGTGPHIRAKLNEQSDSFRMALRGRPHQRRLIVLRFPGVRVGAVHQQRLHGLGLAGARAGHQRGLAVEQFGIRIRPRRK